MVSRFPERSYMAHAGSNERTQSPGTVQWAPALLAMLAAACMLYIFRDGLAFMVDVWAMREEYNHAYLIPIVALYLLWLRAKAVAGRRFHGAWSGLLIVILGLASFILGELSSIYTIIQYSFFLTLYGVVITALGWSGFRLVSVPLVYLVFMIPLPGFLYHSLSAEMQLISSELGVAFIRMVGIPVFLEGNVIDLGLMQLQVAEACNGLRYLFPLLSFGFLCGAIYHGPVWHRVVVFLSVIPITILMNSLRIGVIGVLVENFGVEQAEGFLHYFEGWVIFMICVGILILEMWALNRASGKRPLMEVFGLDVPPVADMTALLPRSANRQFIGAVVLVVLGIGLTIGLQEREGVIPERQSLASFPIRLGDWRGRDHLVDQVYLDELKLDDYLRAVYRNGESGQQVELWIAYYESQRKGESVHSPRSCLPGGGWKMDDFGQRAIGNVGPDGEALTVNRVVITKGEARQLVYYWFEQRGREVTNEYLVKWYIFWDSLTRNRTDGALVRVTTFVPDMAGIDKADTELEDFVRQIDPSLTYHLPQESAAVVEAQAKL